jgi:hypothetical protein
MTAMGDFMVGPFLCLYPHIMFSTIPMSCLPNLNVNVGKELQQVTFPEKSQIFCVVSGTWLSHARKESKTG